MSWHITVYPKAVREQYENAGAPADRDRLLEETQSLPRFSKEDMEQIKKHLDRRQYTRNAGGGRLYHAEYPGAEVLLTDHAVYFTGKGEDGTMEISMTASEFAGSYLMPKDTFAVFDQQDQRWEG